MIYVSVFLILALWKWKRENYIVAAIRPERTVRTSAVIIEIQPNFKVKGQRFSSLELKRLFNELVENSL